MSERFIKEFTCDNRDKEGLLCGYSEIGPQSAITGPGWAVQWSEAKKIMYHFCPNCAEEITLRQALDG